MGSQPSRRGGSCVRWEAMEKMYPAPQVWSVLRSVLHEKFHFGTIKAIAGHSGIDLTAMAHLEQRTGGTYASKSEMLGSIDRQVGKMDTARLNQFLRIAQFALWTMRFSSLRFLRNQARNIFGTVKVTWRREMGLTSSPIFSPHGSPAGPGSSPSRRTRRSSPFRRDPGGRRRGPGRRLRDRKHHERLRADERGDDPFRGRDVAGELGDHLLLSHGGRHRVGPKRMTGRFRSLMRRYLLH